MRTIALKVWTEPAVAIGLLVSIGLLIANLIGTPDWSAQGIIAIVAPLASALGIRKVVSPDHGPPPVPEPSGTTYRKPEPR